MKPFCLNSTLHNLGTGKRKKQEEEETNRKRFCKAAKLRTSQDPMPARGRLQRSRMLMQAVTTLPATAAPETQGHGHHGTELTCLL